MINLLTGRGNLPEIHIQNNAAHCEISLMGAHILSYIPRGHRDVMFLSEESEYTQTGKAIRGGIPVCWPWFGAPDKEKYPNATTSHGFIRQFMWKVISWKELSLECTEVVLGITDSPESRAIWPYAFNLEMTVRIGATLEIALTTTNTGDQEFTYAQALHTYYAIGACETVRVKGFAGRLFIDKAPANPPVTGPHAGDATITAETDRIYLNCPGQAVIVDPTMGRKIVIDKEGSDTGVIWNPWIAKSKRMSDFGDEEYHNMICVENCNVDYDAVTLKAGASHTLRVKIAVEKL